MPDANPRVQEVAEQVRNLLVEAATLAVMPHMTAAEKARFDLTIANPGPETYQREADLTNRMNQATEGAINAAIAAVWMAAKHQEINDDS